MQKVEKLEVVYFIFVDVVLASSTDCSIEVRLSDSFLIKKADFDAVIIVRIPSKNILLSLLLVYTMIIQNYFSFLRISVVSALPVNCTDYRSIQS